MIKTKSLNVIHVCISIIVLIFGAASPAFSCLQLKDTVSVFEGTEAVFEIDIDQSCYPLDIIFRYKYTTVDDTAVAPGDYKKQEGTTTFFPGLSSAFRRWRVKTYDEGVCEGNERFKLRFSDLEIRDENLNWVAGNHDRLPSAIAFSAEIKQWYATSLNQGGGQHYSTSHSGCGSSGTFGE